MAKEKFTETYYKVAQCLNSDLIADFNPVTRVCGCDTSAGFATVFTAMGSRFDIKFVAEEAFLATDSYEVDTRSIDNVPVNEAMRYVRRETIAEDAVPDKYKNFVETVRTGGSVFKDYKVCALGDEDSEVLFLMSPSHKNPEEVANKFTTLVSKLNKKAYCTNEMQTCGYLTSAIGLRDQLDEFYENFLEMLDSREAVVTDDTYILDVLLSEYPDLKNKVFFIDEYLLNNGFKTTKQGLKIVLQESGIINRLYPLRKVDYSALFAGNEVSYPARSGYDVTDSGLAGGLGFADEEVFKKLSSRRNLDLNEIKGDVVVSVCANESFGLNYTNGKTITILDCFG